MMWVGFAELLGILIAVVAAAIALWPLHAIVVDVWKLPMLVRLRPAPTIILGAVIGFPLFLASIGLLGQAHIAGRMFVILLFAAWPIMRGVSWWVWLQSDPETRAVAAQIRNELAVRMGDRPVGPERVWTAYAFDVERARRRADYEPPPI